MDLKKLMAKSLNGQEIYDFFDGKLNIISYRELINYKTIDEVLGKYNMCVLLFLSKPNYGHWTCVFRTIDDGIEFFDSYSFKPDSELSLINMDFRKQSNQQYPYLTYLLYKSGKQIEYNHHKFQKISNSTQYNTCGRWVCIRLLFRELKLNKFIKLFDIPNADEFITKMTYFI